MHIHKQLIMLCIVISSTISARSPFRPEDPLMPEIITQWCGDSKEYHFKSSHLEEHAIFNIFNKNYFFKNVLPNKDITFRNDPTKSVRGSELNRLIEDLIKELHELYYQKNHFKHFIVLKNQDYNPRTHSGLIVLKFKKYPFVVKLFMETPESFVRPYSKGIIPSFMFVLGRGTSRHGSGFTRLPNLETVRKKLDEDPYWSTIIDTPRKWFFYSPHCRWFKIRGKNIGIKKNLECEVPGTYGIICDAIEADTTQSMYKRKNRKHAITLSHYLDCAIDPHICNFMIEKNTSKIVIIDTEHFPSLVGLDECFNFNNYVSYYVKLAHKYCHDSLFRNKQKRRDAQKRPVTPIRRDIINTLSTNLSL